MKKFFQKLKEFFTSIMFEEEEYFFEDKELTIKQQNLLYLLNDIYDQRITVLENDVMLNHISYCFHRIPEDIYQKKCDEFAKQIANLRSNYISDVNVICQA